MEEAAGRVVAGEVTRAVRRERPRRRATVAVGDWIGLSRAGIESVGTSLADATIGAARRDCSSPGHEIVTLDRGRGLDGRRDARP